MIFSDLFHAAPEPESFHAEKNRSTRKSKPKTTKPLPKEKQQFHLPTRKREMRKTERNWECTLIHRRRTILTNRVESTLRSTLPWSTLRVKASPRLFCSTKEWIKAQKERAQSFESLRSRLLRLYLLPLICTRWRDDLLSLTRKAWVHLFEALFPGLFLAKNKKRRKSPRKPFIWESPTVSSPRESHSLHLKRFPPL